VGDPLTILLLAPASSLHTRRWAAALAGSGHRVVVASWPEGPPLPAGELRVAPMVRLPVTGARLPVIGARLPVIGARLPVAGARLLLAGGWLRRLVAEVRPDLIHVQSLGTHGLLALALPAGPPRVVTPWGSELRAARRSAARAAVIRLAVRRADLVLPTSAEVAGEMMNRYRVSAARIRVLSWGVADELISARASVRPDAIRSAFGIPADATVVLSVRSATATYRIREVVSAFAEAARSRPELFLVVLAGTAPASGSYLGDLRAAAPGNRMLIVERTLGQPEVFGLMCAADVAVSVPAADQRSSSVLEAALAGCRLLLSDIAPYREMARDGLAAELLAEPVGRSLADALRRVRPDEAGRAANVEFIRAHERGADKAAALERVYRELATRRGSR
jgi:glycosyltransferase involved in cell wall biosynthesis